MNQPTCKVLVTCETKHASRAEGILKKSCDVQFLPNPSRSNLLDQIRDCDAIVTNLTQMIDKEVMDTAPSLRLISTPSTGTDHIDKSYAASRNIDIHSLKGDEAFLETIPSTAEHAFLLTLAILRNLPGAMAAVKQGRWDRDQYRGHEAEGKVVGVVGYGRLGKMYARIAHAFGMHVIASDPNVHIEDPWVTQFPIDELYRRAEVISFHLHLDEQTKGMVGAHAFSLMRDQVCIVNTSRGAIIDEKVFLQALTQRKIKAAAVDVLANELDMPISDIPLVRYAATHDNLIITPHVGGCTYEAQAKSYARMAERLVDYFEDVVPLNNCD